MNTDHSEGYRVFKHLRQDVRGIAATEFALVVPVMLLVYFGVVEISRAARSSQKVDHIAHLIADFTARKLGADDHPNQAWIVEADLVDFFAAANALIAPLPKNKLLIEIDEIKLGNSATRTKPKLMWSVLYNPNADRDTTSPRRPCGEVDPANGVDEFRSMPLGLAYSDNPNSYVIGVRVFYDYGAGSGPTLFTKALTFAEWSYAVPRITPPTTGDNPIILKTLAQYTKFNGVICP